LAFGFTHRAVEPLFLSFIVHDTLTWGFKANPTNNGGAAAGELHIR
jgi:hypothetical protein